MVVSRPLQQRIFDCSLWIVNEVFLFLFPSTSKECNGSVVADVSIY